MSLAYQITTKQVGQWRVARTVEGAVKAKLLTPRAAARGNSYSSHAKRLARS
jgi:hypothetical protein